MLCPLILTENHWNNVPQELVKKRFDFRVHLDHQSINDWTKMGQNNWQQRYDKRNDCRSLVDKERKNNLKVIAKKITYNTESTCFSASKMHVSGLWSRATSATRTSFQSRLGPQSRANEIAQMESCTALNEIFSLRSMSGAMMTKKSAWSCEENHAS